MAAPQVIRESVRRHDTVVNKAQLKKAVGFRVQLRPAALDGRGQPVDADWIIRDVDDTKLRIEMVGYGYAVSLGIDHVYSFLTNPQRDSGELRYGFLQLLVQLTVSGRHVHVEPIPPPKTPGADAVAHARRFRPLVLEDRGVKRYFSWRGRDPLHLIQLEEEPRQLRGFARPLCEALRSTDLVPQFDLASKIRGEVVYELSPDFQAKWKLLGGMGDAAGEHILVLVPQK